MFDITIEKYFLQVYNCTRNQFVDDLHFIPRGVVMKNRKFLISLLALNLAFGFTCPAHFYQNSAVISASAETMTPEEFNNFFIQEMTKQEKTMTLDDAVAIFKENGYENYTVFTSRTGTKQLDYWWGLIGSGDTVKMTESKKSGDFYYSLNDNNEAEINGYNGKIDTLIIPETLDGHTVTAVSAPYKTHLYFNEDDILVGGGGGGGGSFGGYNYYSNDELHTTELYLPLKCTMKEPHCLYVSTFYIYEDSVAEKYLIENGLNFKYRDDISTDDETTDDETTDGETTDGETTDGETTADEYTTGDADGNGKIDVTDIAVTASHIKGIKALNAAGSKAADANRDGNVDVGDIAAMAAHIKGIKAIK